MKPMKPIETLRKMAVIAMAILMFGAVSAQAEPAALQNDADGLARWQMTYDGLRDMSPKWGVQGIEAFKASLDAGVPVVFVDVRTPTEWAGGVVKGAVLINLNALPTAKGQALLPSDRNAIIGVYCKSGHRSALALTLLHQLGYKNAINVKGGWEAWSTANYPTTDGPPAPAEK